MGARAGVWSVLVDSVAAVAPGWVSGRHVDEKGAKPRMGEEEINGASRIEYADQWDGDCGAWGGG